MTATAKQNENAQKLLSASIAEAAASAAVAAVRSILSQNADAPATEQKSLGKKGRNKTGGQLKFTKQELNTMSLKLRNYFICKDRVVKYRFHKGVYEVNYRRDGIKIYVAATDPETLKTRFRAKLEQYFSQHPEVPRHARNNYAFIQAYPLYPQQPMMAPIPVPQLYTPVPAIQPQFMETYPAMQPHLTAAYPAIQQTPLSPQQEALSTVLFTDYVAQWLALKKPTVKPRTYQEYERMSKYHFEKDFGGVLLKDMTRTRIQEYLFHLVDEGKYRTAEKLQLAFNCIFDLAADDLGFVSPMRKIVLPYHESKKGSALTKEEEKKLVDFCIAHKENEASSALLTMLYCGLRRSELATIRPEENALVCTTSKQRQGRVEVDRKIPFTPVFRRVLPFVNFERAKVVNLSTVHTTFKRLFPERHPHELRYTFITRAKEAGCNLEAVMLWAGHSFDKDVKTSAVDRGYTDYSDEYLYNEAQKIDYTL